MIVTLFVVILTWVAGGENADNILASKNKKVTEDMVFTRPEQVNPALIEEDVMKIFPECQKYFYKDEWDCAMSLIKLKMYNFIHSNHIIFK